MIQMYPSLPCNISFLTGKGNLKRNIQPVYNKLGHRRASAILGFHALTGSDMSGRFAGRSKEWCSKVFMACDDDILNALESLGHRDLSQEDYDQLERFVCQLYKSKVYTKVNEYRWFLSRSGGGESSTNNWLTNTAYSTSTLRSNDLEKGRGKPSTPPVSGRLWLGV